MHLAYSPSIVLRRRFLPSEVCVRRDGPVRRSTIAAMVPQVQVADKLGQFAVLLVNTGRSRLTVALGTTVEKMQVGKAV